MFFVFFFPFQLLRVFFFGELGFFLESWKLVFQVRLPPAAIFTKQKEDHWTVAACTKTILNLKLPFLQMVFSDLENFKMVCLD